MRWRLVWVLVWLLLSGCMPVSQAMIQVGQSRLWGPLANYYTYRPVIVLPVERDR